MPSSREGFAQEEALPPGEDSGRSSDLEDCRSPHPPSRQAKFQAEVRTRRGAQGPGPSQQE